jgi:hypothetical protein
MANVQALKQLIKRYEPFNEPFNGHCMAMLSDEQWAEDLTVMLRIQTTLTVADESTRITTILGQLHDNGLVLPIHQTLATLFGNDNTTAVMQRLASQVLPCNKLIDHLNDTVDDFQAAADGADETSYQYQAALEAAKNTFLSFVTQAVNDLDRHHDDSIHRRTSMVRENKQPPPTSSSDPSKQVKFASNLGMKQPTFDDTRGGESLWEFEKFTTSALEVENYKGPYAKIFMKAFFKKVDKLNDSVDRARAGASINDIIEHCFAENSEYLNLAKAQRHCEATAEFASSQSDDHDLLAIADVFHDRVRGWRYLKALHHRVLKTGARSVPKQDDGERWISQFVLDHLTPDHRLDHHARIANELDPWAFLLEVRETLRTATKASPNKRRRETVAEESVTQNKKVKKNVHRVSTGPVCRDFQAGRCRRQDCRYEHPGGSNPSRSNRDCYNWSSQGSCSWGDRCRFRHTDTGTVDNQSSNNFSASSTGTSRMTNTTFPNAISLADGAGRGRMSEPHTTTFPNPYLAQPTQPTNWTPSFGRGRGGARGGFATRGGKGGKGGRS